MRLAPIPREGEEPEPSTIEPVKKRLAIYPTLRFKLDPTNDWTDELIAAARRDGRRRLARPQGPVQGHPGRRRHRSGALPQADRGVPGSLARGPRRQRRDQADPRPRRRPRHLGRADPLGRRHQGPALAAEDGQHQALALRAAERAVRRPTTTATPRGSAPTEAASGSSVRAAATSSTWPRSSIPTRPTTWRRRATTPTAPNRGYRRARSTRRRPRPASAGTETRS